MQRPKLLRNIGLLLSPRPDGSWNELRSAALLFADTIIEAGSETELLPAAKQSGAEILDAGGRLVTPGFVDSHTHPAFAEPRAEEFELRSLGKTYQEIAAEGGGIRS